MTRQSIETWDEWDNLENLTDNELILLFVVVFDKVAIHDDHVYQHHLNKLYLHLFYRLLVTGPREEYND